MKKIISVLVLAALVSAAASAQNQDKSDQQWREKVRAEQVAFITSQLDLSEAEAQKFWPVYNEIQSQRREAYKASFQAMKELEESLQKEEDTDKKLDKYIAAKKKIAELENDAAKKYSKVLPKKKVAKLVLSEERFRHNQIGKLGVRNGQGQGRPQDGQRPQGGQKGQRPGKKVSPRQQ